MAKQEIEFLYDLERVLTQRKKEMPEGSYTTSLFKEGIDKIAQKLGEEAVETIIASKNEPESEVVYESADLIYHLLVLLAERDIPLDSVIRELKGRSKK
jgi:phosphoribosyl-ATP pyrophosphohydrolase